ncbi:MAG: hypothetical protein OXU42_03980 [Deltaproteobacteria bacterium]|nr:hypothetical protein [Deltaproteobacteria bacterium]
MLPVIADVSRGLLGGGALLPIMVIVGLGSLSGLAKCTANSLREQGAEAVRAEVKLENAREEAATAKRNLFIEQRLNDLDRRVRAEYRGINEYLILNEQRWDKWEKSRPKMRNPKDCASGCKPPVVRTPGIREEDLTP